MAAVAEAFAARGAIWLTGSGALDFLHRLTTATVAGLRPGEGAPTLLLTDAGRVIDALDVYAGEDGILVLTSTVAAAAVVTGHLRALVLYGDEVRVTDASAQVAVLTLSSDEPGIAARIAAALGFVPAAGWTRHPWHGQEVWLLTGPNELKADVVVPIALLPDAVAAVGTAPEPSTAFDCWRVRRGFPAFGAELGVPDAGNPHELGLMDQVDGTKGCYVGQEVVARLDTYDKVQRALVRVEGTGLAPGMRLAPQARGRPGPVTTAPSGCVTAETSALPVATGLAPPHVALGLAPLPVGVGDELRVLDRTGAVAGTAVVMWRAGSR